MLVGCGGPWKTTYVSAATTKELVTTVHKETWSEPLRERKTKCGAELDPEVHTKADFDRCTEPFTEAAAAKVVQALEVYQVAATALSAVLMATDPANPDKAALRAALAEAIEAATQLLQLLPEGDRHLKTLNNLVK